MRDSIFSNFFRAGILLSLFLGCGGEMEGVDPSSLRGSLLVSVQDDRLSVKVDQVPLWVVLAELGRQTGIKVDIEGSVSREQISVEFKDLPLEDGIRRILQSKNYALTYAKATTSGDHFATSKLIEIRVAPKSSGPSIAKASKDPATVILGEETKEVQERFLKEWKRVVLEAPDSKERANALEALGDKGEEEEILSIIVASLRDKDPHVRGVALSLLEESGGSFPLETLNDMALRDSSPYLRMTAIELLAETDERAALDTLKRAIKDPDPRVSHLAQGLIEDIEGVEDE